VASLQLFGVRRVDLPSQLASGGARKESAAHADAPVDAPAVDRQAALRKRALPGKDMCVHGVNQGAVQIEDHRAHAYPPCEWAS